MASNEYSNIVQLIAEQIVKAVRELIASNNRNYLPETLKNTQISADMISGEMSVSHVREFDAVTARIASAVIKTAKIDAAQIENLKVTDAEIENLDAGKITSGQINTELVKIYSGDDLSFVMKGDGLYAYDVVDGVIDPTTYVCFNREGITLRRNGMDETRIGWDGFYMGVLDGSMEITADDGIVVYDRPLGNDGDTRQKLICIGKYYEGDVVRYGMRFYKTVNGVSVPTMTADSEGRLWLDGRLEVGNPDEEGSIAIDGETKTIGTVKYASGAIGNGWRISGNGDATFNNITARGQISASVFEYEKISSVGGSLYVAPTLIAMHDIEIARQSYDGADYYVMDVLHGFTYEHESAGRVWGVNDIVSLQGLIVEEGSYELVDLRCMIESITQSGYRLRTVTDVTSITVYNAETKEKYPNGNINLDGMNIAKGCTMIYMGTLDNGRMLRRGLYLTASESNGPYLDVYDSSPEDYNPKVRLGNLSGISDNEINGGRGLQGYGLYSENVYLKGTVVANKGKIAGWEVGDHALKSAGGTIGLGDASDGAESGDYMIWAGSATPAQAPFSVQKDGTIVATKLDLTGNESLNQSIRDAISEAMPEDMTAGSQNFVQASRPTSYNVGDTWQDSANNYKLYVAKAATGIPEVDWVPSSVSVVGGSSISLNANTGVMQIATDKSMQIAAGGVIDLVGNNAVHVGSGGTVVVDGAEVDIEADSELNVRGANVNVRSNGNLNIEAGSKVRVAADDLIVSGKTLSVNIGDAVADGIDNVKVGGTNLLINSDEAFVFETAYASKRYDYDKVPTHGETVTMTIWGELGTGKEYFSITNTNGSKGYQIGKLILASAGVYQAVGTWKTASTGEQTDYIQILVMPQTGNGVSRIDKIKIERGNKGTDWSPAPGDVSGKFVTIDADIDGIKTRVGNNESSITTLTQTTSGLGTQVKDVSGNVTSLNQSVSSLQTNVQNVQGSVSTLQQTANALEVTVGKKLDADKNSVGVSNSAMTLTKDEFTLAFSGKNVMEVDSDSAVFDVDTLTATGQIIGNVVNTQKAVTVTVPAGASIQSAIDNLNKYLLGDVTIYVEGQHTENVMINGFYGMGGLNLIFKSGAVLSGSIEVWYSKCVSIIGPSQTACCLISTASNCIRVRNVERFYLSNAYVMGNGSNCGVYADFCMAHIAACNFAKMQFGIRGVYGAQVMVENCIGGGTGDMALDPYAINAYGGADVSVYGNTRPMGTLYGNAGRIHDYNATPTSSSGQVPVVNATITAVPSVTYSCVSSTAAGNSSLVHDWGWYANPFQGKYSAAGGYMHGIWIYSDGLSAVRSAISGKTIVSATLTVKRADAYGTDGKTMRLWYHDKTAKPSGSWPSAILTDTGLTATVDRGKTVTFELTSALVDKIKSGAIKGFGVSSIKNTELMQFDAAVCDLTVIYKT